MAVFALPAGATGRPGIGRYRGPDAYQSFPAVAARELYQSTDSCSN